MVTIPAPRKFQIMLFNSWAMEHFEELSIREVQSFKKFGELEQSLKLEFPSFGGNWELKQFTCCFTRLFLSLKYLC